MEIKIFFDSTKTVPDVLADKIRTSSLNSVSSRNETHGGVQFAHLHRDRGLSSARVAGEDVMEGWDSRL